MTSLAHMVGSVVSGKLRRTGPLSFSFDTETVLGTAFVVNKPLGNCITCAHVITEEDVASEQDFAFFTLDLSYNFSVHPIIKSTIRRHPTVDALMFSVQNPIGLKPWEIDRSELPLAQDVIVIGFAKDHMASRPGNNKVVPRALKSYVVSGYEQECEIDKSLITTMSGGPVLSGGHVVGIAAANRQYAIDQYLTETVSHEVNGQGVRKEVYEYKETSRFGVFVKASAWLDWANESIS